MAAFLGDILLQAPSQFIANFALRMAALVACSVAERPDVPCATPDFRRASSYSFVVWCFRSALAMGSNHSSTLRMPSGIAARSVADGARCSVADGGRRGSPIVQIAFATKTCPASFLSLTWASTQILLHFLHVHLKIVITSALRNSLLCSVAAAFGGNLFRREASSHHWRTYLLVGRGVHTDQSCVLFG